MQLGAPWILSLLIPAAVVVILLERRLPGTRPRRVARFLVRMLILTLGALALSEPTRPASQPLERRLVVAVDRSEGMTDAARHDALEALRAITSAAERSGVAVSVLEFTSEASNAVAVVPDTGRGWPTGAGSPWPASRPGACARFRPLPAAQQARLAAGLAGGRAAFDAGEAGTVLVLTNGRGASTGVRSARAALTARGLDIAAVAVPREDAHVPVRPRISAMAVAETTRGPFPVRVAVADATSETRVALLIDGVSTGDDQSVGTGGEVEFDVGDLAPGLHEVAVAITTRGNEPGALARRLVRVGTPPRVLALLLDPAASPLRAALVAQGFDVVTAVPAEALQMLASDPMTADVVVLDAASAAALPAPAQGALLERVRDGLGLVLEAGATEEAWNALAESPLADALAVEPMRIESELPPLPPPPTPDEPAPPVDPPEDADGPGIVAERRPEMALPITLLLLIDRSGSMTGPKLQLAIEGARRAAMALSDWDRVGVITFAETASLDFAPRSAKSAHEIPYWLMSSVQAGGGTDVYQALHLAARVLAKETTPIQHVILLTDGVTGGSTLWHRVVTPMGERGVTVTAVGLGPQHNRRQLRQIMQLAAPGSSLKSVYEIGELPTIMTRDTVDLAEKRSDDAKALDRLNDPDADLAPPEDEPTTDPPPLPPPPPLDTEQPPPDEPTDDSAALAPMVRIRRHDATVGLDDVDLPDVGPPRPNRPRADAAVLLARAGDGEPEAVLAVRRYGLGRVAVWALPADDPGTRTWSRLGQLFAQSTRSALAPEGAFRFVPRLVVVHEPDNDVLIVEWPRGETELALDVVWRDATGQATPLGRFTPNDPDPRRTLPRATAGSLVQLVATLADGRPMAPHTYLAPEPPPPDPSAGDQARLTALFGPPPSDPSAFVRAVPGGRRNRRLPCGDWFLWLLIALLPIDVFLHRRGRPA